MRYYDVCDADNVRDITVGSLSLKLNITAIIIKPAIATVLMFGVMYISSNYISAILGDGFVYLAVMCGIGMSAYVLMLFLTNAISVKEVRKILKG